MYRPAVDPTTLYSLRIIPTIISRPFENQNLEGINQAYKSLLPSGSYWKKPALADAIIGEITIHGLAEEEGLFPKVVNGEQRWEDKGKDGEKDVNQDWVGEHQIVKKLGNRIEKAEGVVRLLRLDGATKECIDFLRTVFALEKNHPLKRLEQGMTPQQVEDMPITYSKLKLPTHPHPYGVDAPYVKVPGNGLLRVEDSVKEMVGSR
ncbi:hypothetical protein HK097_008806 [Rhizophlyctis rosea]|uniref:Uncharacterized protein n=1 Tax=Rhizophlyctis rosea TaxID=64517 RepID=A0AAD5SIQ0_9FUNG|nr:hypothetical protein HK097_008806 [Rhizophlyctis rosea]